MSPTKVVLLACGSFNPPTIMHLRMFEIAKDYLNRLENYVVIGGIMSPVHDSYGKKELVPAKHRVNMLKLALDSNSWIKLSEWETMQEGWSRTKQTIQYHQNLLNAALNNTNVNDVDTNMIHWISNNIKNGCTGPIQVKLLCGADLLESFGTPGLWADEDIETIIGQHGLIVVTREGNNPMKFIYESDILTKYMGNIHIVTEWITNDISSTKIRRALRRSESVRYLVPDSVINYIHQNALYGTTTDSNKYISPNNNILHLLTPSPTDVVMGSPSPPDNRCISICNNNLFIKTISIKQPSHQAIDTVDSVASSTNNNKNSSSFRHPGQAVKILTDDLGEHTIIKNEVRTQPSTTNEYGLLKTSKSCTSFETTKTDLKSSKSNSEICEYQNCDENMIKFIFTKHGIQVISDIETVV